VRSAIEALSEHMERADLGGLVRQLVGSDELSRLIAVTSHLHEFVVHGAAIPGMSQLVEKLSELVAGPLFATHLRNARSREGISIRELERRSGVSNSYISQLESGANPPPSLGIAGRLGRGLSLRGDELREFYLEEFIPSMPEVAASDVVWDPSVQELLGVARRLSGRQRRLLADVAKALEKHLLEDEEAEGDS